MNRIVLLVISGILLSCSSKISKREGGLSRAEKNDGFVSLFDGKSLDNWIDGNNEYYVDKGNIVKKTRGYGNLYSKKEYENFILRFEFLLRPAANNGLGIRHKLVTGKKGYDGLEFQILDDGAEAYKKLKPYQYHGSLYTYVPAKRGYLKPVGEWNYQEMIADGQKIKITLNGTVILETDMDALGEEALKKNPRLSYKKGHIAFLGHDSEVRIRNIRVREFPAK